MRSLGLRDGDPHLMTSSDAPTDTTGRAI